MAKEKIQVIDNLINKYEEYILELQIYYDICIGNMPSEELMNIVKDIQMYQQFTTDLKNIKELIK